MDRKAALQTARIMAAAKAEAIYPSDNRKGRKAYSKFRRQIFKALINGNR